MKDYFKVLDLPKDATEEQIKTKYKMLVRVYHPDRFTKSDDKVYAEEKIKEINEAYTALLRPTHENKSAQEEQPIPVVIPAFIDFGILIPGERKAVPMTVSNARGEIVDLQFDFSDARAWFTLGESKLLTTSEKAPLQFEVVAETNALAPGRTYKGWIDVRMGENTARVKLAVKVARDQTSANRPSSFSVGRVAVIGVGIIAWVTGLAYVIPRYFPSGTPSPQPETTGESVPTPMLTVQPTLSPTPRVIIPSDGTAPAIISTAEQLVYPVTDNGKLVLYTSEVDGSNQFSLKFSGESTVWSPDGSTIAYLAPNEGFPQIFTVQSADRTRDLVTVTEFPKRNLAWAPDGSQIAFLQDEQNGSVLYVTAPGGRRARALSDAGSGTVGNYSWSRDSKSLVFEHFDNNRYRIYQVNADGTDLQPFADLEGRSPVWSPDGQMVAFTNEKGIYTVNASGENKQLLINKKASSLHWSVDGSQLAFLVESITDKKHELWTVNADGSDAKLITKDSVLNFAWSPRSKRIAYVTGTVANSGASSLYLWVITPGENAKLVAETSDSFVTWVP